MQKMIFRTLAAAIGLTIVTGSPGYARFLQTDPIGYEDQINLYLYVGNDPINAIDPNGLEAEIIWRTNTEAELRIPFTIDDQTSAGTLVTAAGVSAQIAIGFSGTTTIDGASVNVTAIGVHFPAADVQSYNGVVNTVTVTDNVSSVCPA